jgi:hypothetical protein
MWLLLSYPATNSLVDRRKAAEEAKSKAAEEAREEAKSKAAEEARGQVRSTDAMRCGTTGHNCHRRSFDLAMGMLENQVLALCCSWQPQCWLGGCY